jgi:sulfopyruvate decarboxylase TPP-binding subunit
VSKPEETLRTLVATGITHVVGLPDSISGPLFDMVEGHPAIRLVTVTREGEAFAIASGLWIGGARPLVVVQNTGLLESGDSLRGTAQRMAVPLPILVTGRGYAKMHAADAAPGDPLTPELLTRPDVDTTALLTEPTLAAWGVPFARCEGDDDPAHEIRVTIELAREQERPVALVVARKLS